MFKIHSSSVSALWGSQGHILRTLYIPCLGRQSVTEHIHIYGNLGWPVHLLACVVLFFFIQVRGNKGTKWKQWEHAKLLTGNNTTSEPKLGPWSCLVSTLPAYATCFFFFMSKYVKELKVIALWHQAQCLPPVCQLRPRRAEVAFRSPSPQRCKATVLTIKPPRPQNPTRPAESDRTIKLLPNSADVAFIYTLIHFLL